MGSHHKIRLPEGLHVIGYPAMLDVPRELVEYVSRLLAAERHARGTRRNSRALTCWTQALFVLVWFRKQEDLAVLGAGFGISRATAYRYHDEGVTVLADQAPDLRDALERAKEEGWAYVILDGKVFSADRCGEKTTSVKGKQIDLWYSGKAYEHGGNIQAISAPTGLPLWVADVEPGSVHDLMVPASMSWAPCTGPRPIWTCQPWPTAATPAPGSAYIPRSNSRPRARCSTRTSHLQRSAARAAVSGRTRVRRAHRPLAQPAAYHRQSEQDR
jgi:hypothetical protein